MDQWYNKWCDLSEETEQLTTSMVHADNNLKSADYIIASFNVPYYKEKLRNIILYLRNRRSVGYGEIIENTHNLCWPRLLNGSASDKNTENELNTWITKEMVPFPELWICDVFGNEVWHFFGGCNNDPRHTLIEKYEKKIPENKKPNIVNRQKEYLPVDKKLKIIYLLNDVIQYYDTYLQYIDKYDISSNIKLEIKEDKKSVKEVIQKVKKVKRINQLDLAKKKLLLAQLNICDDIIITINNSLNFF